jgi:6-pyruvoyltetrahydropterin/6-carboxytetrahydropterin synthase
VYEIGLTHTLDAAHRVVGHEGGRGKCARLHGHTYTFDVSLGSRVLDGCGFVVDFGRIKDLLNEWDHRTLLWEEDPLEIAAYSDLAGELDVVSTQHVVRLPFNPTAENLAQLAAERICDLLPVGAIHRDAYVEVTCRETAKSAATWRIGGRR